MSLSSDIRPIKRALISVYHKDGLSPIAQALNDLGVEIYSTGGSCDYLQKQGIPVQTVEQLTSYPSILGGRVKTLHPKVFGGILAQRQLPQDLETLIQYDIPAFDLVMVDLYPFEATVAAGASDQDIIEKIDVGGISLIRAAAKNHQDVLIISNQSQYPRLLSLLTEGKGQTTLQERRRFAAEAFYTSSHYDTAIFNYFNQEQGLPCFSQSLDGGQTLRYGENPHQAACYIGPAGSLPKQLHGKELSYNNLLDVEAAIELIQDFTDLPTVTIIKHNNACGCASRPSLLEAWEKALAADPVSAFGGIIACNCPIDKATAEAMNSLFFEVAIAPAFSPEALEILQSKKNRILLEQPAQTLPKEKFRSLLHGVLRQDRDQAVEGANQLKPCTQAQASSEQIQDLIFANKLVKHSKSNAIVLAKDQMLVASGVGQTSRVDALKHAIEKAGQFGLSLDGAVMASDAFFPFPDCVALAHEAGIQAVVQPGGSVRDQESIDYCNQHGLAMLLTGIRHFKH
jgi:phosphoribosylaminoimidazolecarboxamide formyltransferase/IMP cyclohydrolase